MNIILNGEETKFNTECIDVNKILSSLNIPSEGLIILINGEIITKDEYQKEIYEGYEVEILRFVSGG